MKDSPIFLIFLAICFTNGAGIKICCLCGANRCLCGETRRTAAGSFEVVVSRCNRNGVAADCEDKNNPGQGLIGATGTSASLSSAMFNGAELEEEDKRFSC